MAYTTINKSGDYFNTKLYTGNGGTQSITGVGFQPDWIWVKERSSTSSHQLIDAVRGYNKRLSSNTTGAEAVDSSPYNDFKSIDSDGFTIGSGGGVNENSQTYASWNWKANGTGSANTAGDINSTVSVNTTAGFSIVKYTGSGSVATIGHGLGVAPELIIVKRLNGGTEAWPVDSRTVSGILYLNQTDGKGSYGNSSPFPADAPTSTLFYVGSANNANASGSDFIAYCFASKTGYSKFGSYTGTSSKVFNYTGFKPRFILIKKTSEAASWHLFDTSRTVSNGGNQLNKILFPNLSNAESDDGYNYVDAVSNGFRCFSGPSGQGTETNKNGETFIYMAFGQSIVGSNNIPATAR